MVDQKINAQVLSGVNDDISEMKSLTTLRKRVVTDGEVVSKSQNAFRLAGGKTGVILRNDGNDFYALVTPEGQAQDGQWNTLRPLSFNLKTGRVSLRNGVDISGGAVVSHDAGISARTTGPSPIINGQTYSSPSIHTDFTSGNITTQMMMCARVEAGKQDYGLLSYRDWQGSWNELRVRSNAELDAGQFTKRNSEGWIKAAGNRNVNNDKDRKTNALWIQGAGDLSADFYHYERITPAPPGMVSLGVNENGEEEMTVIGGDGSGTGFSGNEAPIIPGSGSLQADLGKKSLTRLQAESSAAIHATAKWTTENLAKTQAAQAERAKAAMLSQQAAKAKQAKLTQHLKDVVDRALENNKTRPTVIDLAHQNNQQMAAMAEFIGRQKAIEEARKKAEREAKRAEEAYQAALRAQEEEQRKQAEIERKLQEARKQEAAAKAKAEADRIAAEKAEAEARAKAEAERRKAEEARKALFAKAGIKDTPVYTLEMTKAATTLFLTPGVRLLNRAPAMIQLSALAAEINGVLTTAASAVMTATAEFSGWIASALWRGVDDMRLLSRTLFNEPPGHLVAL